MVEPNGSPVDRAREALQRVEDLLRVATSRAIVLRELFERRHLRSVAPPALIEDIVRYRVALDQLFLQLEEAWGEYSIVDDELASEEETSS